MVINSHLSCLVHQYEAIWSRSTWLNQSNCSTGILESSKRQLVNPSNRMSSYWLGQKFARRRTTIKILKLFSSVIFNSCTLLSCREICVTKTKNLQKHPKQIGRNPNQKKCRRLLISRILKYIGRGPLLPPPRGQKMAFKGAPHSWVVA